MTTPTLPVAPDWHVLSTLPARPRLLVVDDQPINIQTLYQIFHADHEVFMATSGEQALAFCRGNPLPDLILLDGGEPQVRAVLPVVASMGLNVPVFGMVKDSKHRTRAIAVGNGEIEINSHRQVFTLVSNIQEEVHRFAISYHHNKHKKSIQLLLV